MNNAKTATSLTALATALLAAGCSTPPARVYTPVHDREITPMVLSFPQTQSFETRLAWKGPETLGNCLGTEIASAGPIPAGASASAAQTLNMDAGTSATFTGLTRTGLTIACGIGSKAAEVPLQQARRLNPRQAAAAAAATQAAPVFNNVRIAQTGDYFLPNNFTQCKATLVMVQPDTLRPGQNMPEMVHGPRTLPEFGNYQLPAGWAVPKVPVAYNGGTHGSSTLCTHAMTVTKPQVLINQ